MNSPDAAALDELQRQLERGSLFAHTALGESYLRLGELQALVHGLADTLLARGLIGEDELAAAIEHARAELAQRGELAGAGARLRVDADDEAARPPAQVDCQARLPVCKAVCCRLDFALSVPEIEAGRVKWDLGRPYFVRHDAHGRCVHNDAGGGCGVYADRPQVCRRYDCSADTRIWNDFEKMELNQAWIDEHLAPSAGPRAVRVLMRVPATAARPPSSTGRPRVERP